MHHYQVLPGAACFTTHVIRGHTSLFCTPNYQRLICDSLSWCRKNRKLQVYGFVIMPDHLHLLTNVQTPDTLRNILAAFRRFTATQLLKLLRLENRKWALEKLRTGRADELSGNPSTNRRTLPTMIFSYRNWSTSTTIRCVAVSCLGRRTGSIPVPQTTTGGRCLRWR